MSDKLLNKQRCSGAKIFGSSFLYFKSYRNVTL